MYQRSKQPLYFSLRGAHSSRASVYGLTPFGASGAWGEETRTVDDGLYALAPLSSSSGMMPEEVWTKR